ncbi:MAG: metallophosphoesterase family protein [Alphaproteobacteria bacterium]
MIAWPALGKTAWTIQGSEHGVLRLLFYTDVHARQEWETPTALMMAADAINAQKADLVLGGGDLIDGGFGSTSGEVTLRWNDYMAMHSAIEGEHHAVIGNHDLVGALPKDGSPPAADPRLDYKRRLGLTRTYRSFDALGYRVMLLDSVRISNDRYKYHGWVSLEQREWIKEELSRLPIGTPIVLVSHIPLITNFFSATMGATFQAKPNQVVVNNTDVLALFAKHNLILVLQGHLHVSELLHWRGATFITGGAVCANWWRGPYFGTEEGFNAITLRRDRVEREYIDYGWQARRPAWK